MRKRVPGVHAVSIDWPAGKELAEPVQCMLVAGSTSQRDERARALLTTGRRAPITPAMDGQLRDHGEVLRVALGDANAHFTPLCLAN